MKIMKNIKRSLAHQQKRKKGVGNMEKRRCKHPGCNTILRESNPRDVCGIHDEYRLENGMTWQEESSIDREKELKRGTKKKHRIKYPKRGHTRLKKEIK